MLNSGRIFKRGSITLVDLAVLQQILGISFDTLPLLERALVHSSYVNENPGFTQDSNERLEFLGDAVLELATTEYLYQHYDNPEGELTNWRAALVNGKNLASVARKIKIENFLFLSRGEAKDTNPKSRNYILANAIEAIIGAIYLDQGWEVAKKFILENILIGLDEILDKKLYIDAKSRFQEEAQEKVGVTPSYQVLSETGPDHNKSFVIGIYLEDELVAKGEGTSKQEAQMSAAENGLKEKKW